MKRGQGKHLLWAQRQPQKEEQGKMRVGEKREKDIDAEGMLTEQKHEERAFQEPKKKLKKQSSGTSYFA